eukprot:6937723-Pyramimonas_sp.AAC.1
MARESGIGNQNSCEATSTLYCITSGLAPWAGGPEGNDQYTLLRVPVISSGRQTSARHLS